MLGKDARLNSSTIGLFQTQSESEGVPLRCYQSNRCPFRILSRTASGRMTIADCRMEERLIDDFWMAYSKRRGACLLSRPTANQRLGAGASRWGGGGGAVGGLGGGFSLQSGVAKLVLEDDGEG